MHRRNIHYILLLLSTIFFALAASHALAQEEALEPIIVEVSAYPVSKPIPVIVDNTIHIVPPGGRVKLVLKPGAEHTISIVDDVIYEDQGARLVFSMWSNGETSPSIKVNDSMALVALYEREYYVEVVTKYGGRSIAGWYREGERVDISVNSTVYLDNNTRLVFTGWSYGVSKWSPQNYFYVFEPVRVTASWKKQFYVNITSMFPARVSGGGWYDENSVAAVRAQPVIAINETVEYRFAGWIVNSGGLVLEDPYSPLAKFVVTNPVSITASYKPYYLVKIYSPYGNVTGGGFYPAGSRAVIAAMTPFEIPGNKRYVFTGWSGDINSKSPSVSFVVEEPVEVTANWKLQFKLTIRSDVPAVQGDGWYDEGEVAVVKADSEVEDRLGVSMVFKGWTGDVKSKDRIVEIVMDSPKTITAIWEKSYTKLYMRFGVITVTIVGVYLLYRYTSFKLLGRRRFLGVRTGSRE
jgi:uncharacterized repeat protein (TIGR02543 family)